MPLPWEREWNAPAAGAVAPTAEGAPQGGVLETVDNVVRQIVKGVPILGGAMDRVAAAGDAATQPIIGRGAEGETFADRYAANLAAERARDTAFETANPKTATALNIGGAIAGALPALATNAGRVALGVTGPMLQRIAAGATSGAVIGGADAAVRGQSPAMGAGVGGTLGMVAPVAGRLAGAAVEKVGEMTAPMAEPIREFGRGAVRRVSGALRDDASTGQAIDPRRYGNEAMVLDVGPNLLGHAETLAHQPGPAGARILGAVTERGQGATGRITSDVDAALGPRRDTPALLQAMDEARATEASGLYGALRGGGTEPVWSDTLADLTRRPSVRAAIRDAEAVGAERGHPVTNPFTVGQDGTLTLPEGTLPNFAFWDHVKRGIDLAIARDPANRDLVATSQALRNELDRLVPGYQEARQRFAERSGIIDAVEEGRSAFKRGVDPNQMRADMAERSVPEQVAYAVGGRQHVADIMGEAVRPDTAARTAFASPYARERLEIVAGPDGAARLVNRLDAETAFKSAENTIRGNSATARRLQFNKFYPPVGEKFGEGLSQTTATGAAVAGGSRLLNALLGGALDARRAGIANDASRMLTAAGGQRDRIVQALADYAAATGQIPARSEAIDRMITVLLASQHDPARRMFPLNPK